MLQDLESRKNAPADTASKKSVYEDLKPVKASGFRAPPNKRLSVILLALAVVGGGAYGVAQTGTGFSTGRSGCRYTCSGGESRSSPACGTGGGETQGDAGDKC